MIAKYILLALTNILAFSGAWLFAFTDTDKATGKKKLTKWGKIALPIALILLVGGLGLTVYDDIESTKKAKTAAETASKKEEKLQGTIERLTNQITSSAASTEAIRALVTAMAKPASAERDLEIATLIKEPELLELAQLSPEFGKAIKSLENSLGGRSAMIERFIANGSVLPNNANDILTVASLDLRMFGHRRSSSSDIELEESRQSVLSLLRGLDADIVSVQEIANLPLFQSVLNEMPQYFALYGRGDARIVQAILARRDRLKMLRPPLFLDSRSTENKSVFVRAPIIVRLQHDAHDFTVVAFHLKSQYGSDRGVKRRSAEIAEINRWLSRRSKNDPILFMGRTQVGLDAPELQPLLEQGIRFGSAELKADASTLVSKKWGSIVMSHIGGYGSMSPRLIEKTTEIYSLEKLLPSLSLDEIRARVTDHNPIVTAFTLE